MQYTIVIDKTQTGYGGYVPDLPGIGVLGDTAEEVEGFVRETIASYIEDRRQRQLPIPSPSAVCKYVEPAAA